MRHLLATLLLSVFSLPALAEGPQPWWKFWQDTEAETPTVEVVKNKAAQSKVFSSQERSILNDYLRNTVLGQSSQHSHYNDDDHHDKGKKHKDKKQKALPPGLQKKVERGGELPPGWQKKVARGEVLDRDLYLASQGLPQDVLNRLPTSPVGTTIRRIDDRIVRVMDATGVILDVLGGGQ